MAFETGLLNEPTPIQNLGQASGRLVKENNFVVNAADLLAELIDADSNVSLNVNVVIDPTPPVSNISTGMDEGLKKILFSSDLSGGFDTYYDWVLAFNGVMLSSARNASAINGNDSIGPVTIGTGIAPVMIDCAGPSNTVYDMYSNNFLKIGNSGKVFAERSGIFKNTTFTSNTEVFGLKFLGIGDPFFEQDEWNVDTFGANPALNPSGITLDFTKFQTLFFEFDNKNRGDIRVGFVLENVYYLAHSFTFNNEKTSYIAGDLNLPFRETVYRTPGGDVVREIGVFTHSLGVSFVNTMDTTNDPSLIAEYSIGNTCVYSVGSDIKDIRKPFVHKYDGGDGVIEYKTISTPGSPEPLFALRPKPEISPGFVNRTVFGIDSIQLYTRSLNLNDSASFDIYWGTITGGTYFPISSPYSAMEYSNSFTVSQLSAIRISSAVVSGNGKVTVYKKDILNDYMNNFSIKSISYAGAGVLENFNRGTIYVRVKPTVGTASIEVGAIISGFEIA